MDKPTHQAEPHGRVAKLIHWLTAGLLAYGYMTGVDDISEIADPARFQTEILFAVALGLAFLLRFVWMQGVNGHSRLPEKAPRWEHVLSRLAHYGIYAGVGLIVLSGLAIAYAYSTPSLGDWFLTAMVAAHEVSLAGTAVLLIAHVVGALWHKFVRKNGIWESMLPDRARAD